MQKLSDTTFQFVPYRGIGPAMLDLVAGQIDLLIGAPSVVLPQVRAGTIKAYAVTAKTRLAAAPDIPSVGEAGLPGLYISSWRGLWAPKGTPRNVISKLNASVVDVLAPPPHDDELPISERRFRRLRSRPPRRSPHCRRLKSRSGGRSSRRPELR